MTKWIFLVSTLAVAYSRPQINLQGPSGVEIEKQHVVEIIPEPKQLFQDSKISELTEKQVEEHTKQILEKIALVNEQQGLNKKKPKPQHNFPFSYHRSQDNFASRQSSDFKFPREPFSNPILDYVERKNSAIDSDKKTSITSYASERNGTEKDDIPPGHYIKRKITHQQTMILPSPVYFSPNLTPPQGNMEHLYGMNQVPEMIKKPEKTEVNKIDLEKQTVDTIKNIVENSQHPMNPYQQLFNPYQSQPGQGLYQVYGPYISQQMYRPGKQWQSPLAQYFPIVIKDPLVQFFNALTTMVEYGPQGGGTAGDACSKQAESTKTVEKITEKEGNAESAVSSRAKQIPEKLTYSVVDNGNGAEVTVGNNDSNSTTVIDIEDLQITDNKDDSLKLKLNFRQSKQNEEIVKKFDYSSPSESLQITESQLKSNVASRQSPPVRDQVLYDDETVNDEESEKAEIALISQDGTKKMVSKDNTGSGIFVHRIKVRKGGVAIAGPGGIATAGSGGTAIVGPNGFAYTHPDSLAIAGSGTKVVAVEPTINLSQVVMDHNKNKTRGDGHIPPRIGKVVAVGPVIYYNRG